MAAVIPDRHEANAAVSIIAPSTSSIAHIAPNYIVGTDSYACTAVTDPAARGCLARDSHIGIRHLTIPTCEINLARNAKDDNAGAVTG